MEAMGIANFDCTLAIVGNLPLNLLIGFSGNKWCGHPFSYILRDGIK